MHATLMDGRNVTEKRIVIPKPIEIAIAMGRICRYAGQLPVSLITHSLLVAWFAWKTARYVHPQKTRAAERRKRWMTACWALLHDVHEVITGDSIGKSSDLEMFQERIDVRVAREYKINMRYVDQDLLHSADMTARFVEVKAYGSDKMLANFAKVSECERPLSNTWLDIATKWLDEDDLTNMRLGLQTRNGILEKNCCETVRRFAHLLKSIKRGLRSRTCLWINEMVRGVEG